MSRGRKKERGNEEKGKVGDEETEFLKEYVSHRHYGVIMCSQTHYHSFISKKRKKNPKDTF